MTESYVRTVLIVESSVQDRSQYKGFLGSRAGQAYSILEAETAQAALHLCKSQRLDCVLVSSQLSDGHPSHFLRTLKSDPALKKLPVVMMLSEQEPPEATRRAFVEGVVDCISKNARWEEQLVRATHNALQIAEMTRLVTQETTLRARAEASLQKRGLPLPKEGTRSCPRGLLFLLNPSGLLVGANQLASRWLAINKGSAGMQDMRDPPFSFEPPADLPRLMAQCLDQGHAQAAGVLGMGVRPLYPVTLFFDRIDREDAEDPQVAVTLADRSPTSPAIQTDLLAQPDPLMQADILMARAHAAVEALAEVLGGASTLSSVDHESVGAVHSLLARLPAALLAPSRPPLALRPEPIVPK